MEKVLSIAKKIIPRRFFLALQPPYHFLLAFLAALAYGFPSRFIYVAGVTGTKGKTTVVELLHGILERNGAMAASASSLRFKTRDKEEKNFKKMTMPGRFFLQKFLRNARKNRCSHAVLEVTSEGIKQHRHRFIRFSAAVMTNISAEHILAHGSYEKYLRAKLDLFWRLSRNGIAVINKDDAEAGRFAAATRAKKIFYGKDGIAINEKKWEIRNLSLTDDGIAFELNGVMFKSALLGEFNFYNILAGIAFGLSQHVPLEKIREAVSNLSCVPGRMEFIQKDPFAVVVDYAHTPDSLRNVYAFLREGLKSKPQNSKLICVLGAAGGGRDTWKRPEMGKIAAEFCDEIILTNEDPYDENPAGIVDEIEAGFSKAVKFKKNLDRREAIRAALAAAAKGDTVIITGKGAEPWIAGPGGTKAAWDDREVVREELKNTGAQSPLKKN